MLATRSLLVGLAVRHLLQARKVIAGPINTPNMSQRLSHHWSYRTAPPPVPKSVTFTAEAIAAGMWWWILWHLWHEYEHITGEFEYPDPSAWTNKELGIPPDSEN